jgi:hypothetical protein
MKNISNLEIRRENCTQCPNCGERDWYVMECDCGFKFCRHCSAEKCEDNEIIILTCPKCGNSVMYV